MTGLIVTPPTPASPANSAVVAGDFWPPVDLNALRESLRLGDTLLPHARLVLAAQGALAQVQLDLATWQARQLAAGAETLADVQAELTVDGETLGTVLFTRAVRYLTAAELADGHADLAATGEGIDRAADKRMIGDDYRRIASAALSGLQRLGAADPTGPVRAGGVMVDLV